MPVPSDIQILRSTEEFASLIPEWRSLWFQDPTAKPFQRPEWLLPWWHHFGTKDLHLICIRQAKSLVGLLPVYVYADPARNERQLLLVGAGTSDYLGGLFAPACAAHDVIRALRLLAEELTWDVAYLTQLLPGSLLYQALQDCGAQRFSGENCSFCPALSIPDLPKKIRADVRYFHNAAIGRGTLRMLVADGASVPAAFEHLVQLHSARWEDSQQTGVLADPKVLAWHREAIPQLQAADCLRLYTLTLQTDALVAETVAALYALIDPPERPRRTAYLYLIGYSPMHAGFKPGTLLTAMASEHAAAEGVEMLDMLRGNEAYKRFWKVQEIRTFGFTIQREDLACG